MCSHVDIAVISMDNYNDGTKVVDENFDGKVAFGSLA